MKKLLFISLLFIGFNSFSQKIKNIDVVKISNIYISAIIELDENNLATDTTFFIDGKDSRCEEVIEIISLHHGSLDDIYTFLNYSIIFYENFSAGTVGKFRRNLVYVDKNLGMKTISIYDVDSGLSYTETNGVYLKKLLAKLDSWRNNNKIALKEKERNID